VKIWKLTIYVLIIGFLLSCAASPSVKQVFDESLPLEETTCISTYRAGDVIGYNGIPVKWEKKAMSINVIRIPAGETLLEWNVNSDVGSTIYRGDNMILKYNFSPRKYYYFVAGRVDGVGGFYIYRYDDEKIRAQHDKEKLVGFVPFLNARSANEKTVLN